jgi:hypothetical protein
LVQTTEMMVNYTWNHVKIPWNQMKIHGNLSLLLYSRSVQKWKQ